MGTHSSDSYTVTATVTAIRNYTVTEGAMTGSRVMRTVLALGCLCQGLLAIDKTCTSDLDCSLNGVCSSGVCECDAPWTGTACGVLGYKTTPASGKSLYPESDPRNTWNGPIIRGADDGTYHLYTAIFPKGQLPCCTTTLLHGTAANVTGPYHWGERPDIVVDSMGAFDGPKAVVFTEDNKTKYSLWLGGGVYLADSPDGPFEKLQGFSYPGANPAVVWYNDTFFFTNSPSMTVYTTTRLVEGANWTVHGTVNHSGVPENWIPEDPTIWVDQRGSFHMINHAFNVREWQNCSSSLLSTHFFSPDGKTWHFLPEAIQPYGHTVRYDDGTSHMFVTIERPTVFLDAHGQLTHLHLAADLVTGDEGCGDRKGHNDFGHCACVNCKYEDHGGTTIIALDV